MVRNTRDRRTGCGDLELVACVDRPNLLAEHLVEQDRNWVRREERRVDKRPDDRGAGGANRKRMAGADCLRIFPERGRV